MAIAEIMVVGMGHLGLTSAFGILGSDIMSGRPIERDNKSIDFLYKKGMSIQC